MKLNIERGMFFGTMNFMHKKIPVLVLLAGLFSGCASFWDAPKNVVGFSTRSLEAARATASVQIYEGSPGDVFNAAADALQKEKYYVFTKDEIRGFIAVLNIPGVVDTSEVGA